MSHYHTIFSQILKFVPRHEFETLAKEHHSRRSFYKSLPDNDTKPQFSLQEPTLFIRCFYCRPLFVGLSIGKFRTTKSAIKPHVGLNHSGCLPEFVAITEGKIISHSLFASQKLYYMKEFYA